MQNFALRQGERQDRAGAIWFACNVTGVDMVDSSELDFGPLADLIGTWKGDKGTDIAPEPDGAETNPYFETITVTPVGDVTNAESQTLVAAHYRQVVQRKSNGKVFHDQTGYWMWDAATNTIMHSLTIPRAVSVLAGGVYDGATDAQDRAIVEVQARAGDADWGVIESPFMRDNAHTVAFRIRMVVGKDSLSYAETTIVDIYGKRFEHTDENELIRV